MMQVEAVQPATKMGSVFYQEMKRLQRTTI